MRRAGAMLQHSALCDAAFHVDRYPNASEAHVEARLTREEEKRIGPNAGRPRWRDVDATASHLRAVLHAARAGRAGLYLEEDVELWVTAAELHGLVSALVGMGPLDYAMLGGCWGIHAQRGDGLELAAQLPAASTLYRVPLRSRAATRCGHGYTVSAHGARLLLELAGRGRAPAATLEPHRDAAAALPATDIAGRSRRPSRTRSTSCTLPGIPAG